ncbi:hypothetical protein HBA54_04075 [Pelagibius litoralis]|uniref:UrcA family protein n=1 Tax=Pelagibius litoralis TaxID=374515 RepID=A0A967EVF0_9PROT|nr:hypothetical protein [Pelagibius litoralis]NIA67759.1 hypothetical protein [Pelagibius litoralis]
MKTLLASAACLALLSGCTAGDIATVRALTIEDGAAFIQENHERRRAMRRQYYSIVDTAIAECERQAVGEVVTGQTRAAVSMLDQCLAFMEEHYPDLATIELVKEGRAALNRLKSSGGVE